MFKFINPGVAKILGRLREQDTLISTKGEIWRWEDAGLKFKIDWESFQFSPVLVEILKAFIFHRLETISPQSVASQDYRFLKNLNESNFKNTFPWKLLDIENFLNTYPSGDNGQFTFRKLYHWGYGKRISGFTSEINLAIQERPTPKQNPYESIFLRQNTINPSDEARLLKHLNDSVRSQDRILMQENVILHLAFELAPRPVQIFTLDQSDFIKYNSDSTSYYSINLPLAKKIRTGLPEKRPRSISNALGEKMESLIKLNNFLPKKHRYGLFLDDTGIKRLSSDKISSLVSAQLRNLSFDKGDGFTLLRHHLGQSLADQGASAEVIAEILGHNSTVAARAYVGATPEIADIKTRALGKNGTYLDIMKMLVTGEIIEKQKAPKERWVKGLVGNQYIGGIGSCGLPSNTACPKNPIYSCYTCKRFHPFLDGTHEKVKEALQQHAQFFLDTAEKALQIESNRALTQLESTIQAVDTVVHRCQLITKAK